MGKRTGRHRYTPGLPGYPSFDSVSRDSLQEDAAGLRWAALWALLVVGAIALPLFSRTIYALDDLAAYRLPLRAFYAAALRAGDAFLWHPGLHGGYFLHGEGQIGMLHPLNLVLYRLAPLDVAFNLEIVAAYPLILLGTYGFLRTWGLRRQAAAFGGILFAFSGFNLLHAVHPNMVLVVAHLPALLWAQEIALTAAGGRRSAGARLAITLLTGSQLLLGHPQAVWISLVAEGLYLCMRLGARGSGAAALGVLLAKALGGLAGMVQLLPSWDVASSSNRAQEGYIAAYRYVGSLNPANVVQMVAPYLIRGRGFGLPHPQEVAIYLSLAGGSMVVVMAGLRRGRDEMSRRLVGFCLVLGGLAALLCLGRVGLIYELQGFIPLVRSFGNPERYIVLVHLALAVLAAVALSRLADRIERGERRDWRSLWPLAVLLSASLSIAVFFSWMRAHPDRFALASEINSGPLAVWAGPVLALLAVLLVAAASRGRRWALTALVALAALDGGIYGATHLWPSRVPVEALAEGQALPPSPPHVGRVAADNDMLALSQYRLSGGYTAFRPQTVLEENSPERLRLLGVRWINIRRPWDAEERAVHSSLTAETRETVDALGRHARWGRVPGPLPEARLVSRATISSRPAQDAKAVDLETTVIAQHDVDLGGGRPGSVRAFERRPGRLRVELESAGRQVLVLAESWHEGWRAEVDGVRAPVLKAYGDLIGVVVEDGAHDVVLRFRPMSFRLGFVVSLAAILSSVALWWSRSRAGPTD